MTKRCLVLCSGLALVCVCGAAAPRRAEAQEPRRVALLAGVDKYQKPGFRPLQFAEADVKAVRDELTRLGWQVTTLLGSESGEFRATRENLEATAMKLAAPLSEADLMLVMLSGHGQQLHPDPNAAADNTDFDKFQSFYCPVDAVVNRPETQFSLSHLVDDILVPNVGRRLLIVDACRDIPVERSRGRNTKGIEGRTVSLPEGTGILFSCSAGQTSFERDELGHGLFTHCLLEGLRGKAVVDGELTWNDLVAHASRRMTQSDITRYVQGKQIPIHAGVMPPTLLARVAVAASQPTPVPSTPPAAPGESKSVAAVVQAEAARAADLLSKKDFRTFLDEYGPIDEIRAGRTSGGGDAQFLQTLERLCAQPDAAVIELLRRCSRTTPEIDPERGVATFVLPLLKPTAPREPPAAVLSTEPVPGLGTDLPTVCLQSVELLQRRDYRGFVSHVFPVGEVQRLRSEGFDEVTDALQVYPEMVAAMTADLERIARMQPIRKADHEAEFELTSADGNPRRVTFQLIQGHWRFCDHSSALRAAVADQVQIEATVEWERFAGRWRLQSFEVLDSVP